MDLDRKCFRSQTFPTIVWQNCVAVTVLSEWSNTTNNYGIKKVSKYMAERD